MAKASTKKAKKVVATVVNPETGQDITLTPELISQIEKLYRIGMKDSAIANLVGVRTNLMLEWLTKGSTYNSGLHGELFRRCAKALGGAQFEWIAKIREHGLGSAAEYAYNEETLPDGTVKKTLALDGEGKPIIVKREVHANVDHLKWLLEKRFPKAFGKQVEFNIESLVEEAENAAALNIKQAQEQDNQPEGEILVSEILGEAEQIKLLETALRSKKVTYEQDA